MKNSQYNLTKRRVGQKPYVMSYRRYVPIKKSSNNVVVMVCGGGHKMKVWEVTPDGRKGWAPLLASSGREVITVEWACNSPEIYKCSQKELCALTQRENINLIAQTIKKELLPRQKVIFLGWSMGGPQVFKLAADILPLRTVAILGYAATGPLNYFKTTPKKELSFSLKKPQEISIDWVRRQCRALLFPKGFQKRYRQEYLTPFSPNMAAIQSKDPAVRKDWEILTIKNVNSLPPTLLVSGTLDKGHTLSYTRRLEGWLKKFQKDVIVRRVKGFSHLGMLLYGNEKIVNIYLKWLDERGL